MATFMKGGLKLSRFRHTAKVMHKLPSAISVITVTSYSPEIEIACDRLSVGADERKKLASSEKCHNRILTNLVPFRHEHEVNTFVYRYSQNFSLDNSQRLKNSQQDKTKVERTSKDLDW